HHTLCVTQNGQDTFDYVDGRLNGSSSGLTPLGQGTWTVGGAKTADDQFLLIGNLLEDASSMRLTFCDGTTLELHALNDRDPRFVAATYDPRQVGVPSPQQFDAAGRPLSGAHDPSSPDHRSKCVTPTSIATK